MNFKTIILTGMAVVAIGGAVVFGARYTYAQTNSNPFADLVQKIADKFGLDKTKVQAVFDEYRTTQKQNMQDQAQKRQEDRLNTLVSQGKITSSQKDAIVAELALLKNKYNKDNAKNMTPQERQAQFQAENDELKAWAADHGIDMQYVSPGFGMGGKRGTMGGRGNWHKPTVTPTPAS